tara:strand:- start:5402 stop:10270 length:4869 start_codon:yes stop_codon:yes gene_type:complete
MARCPNINLPEWQQLVIAQGEDKAYFLWDNYNGVVPQQLYDGRNSSVIPKVKELIAKMGVSVVKLQDYAKDNPDVDVSSANAIADITGKIIAVSEGATDIEITEEMVHIATAILEQQNPSLVTEMISKIGRFKIYKDTLETYRDNPNYQLEDGRPDIRKIKKEAADKLITYLVSDSLNNLSDPALLEEENTSFFRQIWNAIKDWFRGQYAQSNLDIFKTAAEQVEEGVEGDIIDGSAKDIYFSITEAQQNIQKEIIATKETLRKVESKQEANPLLLDDENANNYYEVLDETTGEYKRVKKRVTDRVKAWYASKFRGKIFTEAEKRDNELKRQLGVEFHNMFEEIHARFFNSDGTRRETPGPAPEISDVKKAQVYAKLEKYYTDLVAEFSKDGKNPMVFSEVMVYDKSENEAGTIDLLIVDEDGKSHIYDWKFMSVAKGAQDVAWYKQGAYGIQLGRYKDILKDNYGVKEIGKNRAVPVLLNLKRQNFQDSSSPLEFTGIGIGSVNPTSVEPLTLTPVSEKTETTGIRDLDSLIKRLNAVYTQIEKTKPTDETDRSSKRERLNIIKQAIRQAQANQNLTPIIDAVAIQQTEGENIIAEYETLYKGRPFSETDIDNAQLSDFADRVVAYLEQAEAFGQVNLDLEPLIRNSSLEKEDQDRYLADIDAKTRNINRNVREIKTISGEFADKYIGLKNNVTGLLDPQALLRGLKSTFRSLSELPLPSLRILSRLARVSESRGEAEALEEVNELLAIRDKLKERGGKLLDVIRPLYQKDSEGGLVNKLIYKYSRDFYDAVDQNAEEGNRSKKFLQESIDIEAYKNEANAILQKEIEKYNKLYDDESLRNKLILEAKRKWDITRQDFNGWNNYVIKRHPLAKWESAEYKQIKQNPDLLALYNFIAKINEKAKDVGYLDNRIQSTFLPFVRKGTAEGLAWNMNVSALLNWAGKLTARADDLGYGSINELTGATENAIPKYYTYDFTQDPDGGPNDVSDVSLEFFKNQILYINHLNKYKYMSDIEGQINLVRTIVKAKDHYKTTRFSGVATEGGKPIIEKGNENNAEIFDLFMENIMYDNQFPADSEDFGVPTGRIRKGFNDIARQMGVPESALPFTEGEEGNNYSVIKFMQTLNNVFQAKTLGLEPISGAVNLFGANIQVAAQAGNYFDAREFAANELKLLGNKWKNVGDLKSDERKMFEELIEIFMPLKDSPTYEKLKDSVISTSAKLDMGTQDTLFAFFRQPELHLERSLFLTLLQNTMVIDGKLVNIKEFVRNKYKDRYKDAESFSNVKDKIKSEISELKKNKSITATMKLEDGKVVVPGLDLKNRVELQRLTNLTRTLARNATGGFTDFDNIKMNMNIWTKSMMVFKGWIPKLVDTRFSEFRKVGDDFTVRVDEDGMTTGEKYDVGRVRLFLSFLSFNIPRVLRELSGMGIGLGKLDDVGLARIDKSFQDYTEYYESRTGEKLNMTREDFIEMVRQNMRKQLQELGLLMALQGMLFALGFMEPEDDADRAQKNSYRYLRKTFNRFQEELMFFYNPTEWSATLSGGILPSVSLFAEAGRFMTHFYREVTGFDHTNQNRTPREVRRDALPLKYLMKLFPVTKSLVQWLAMFDPQFAKDFDVTIQERRRR